MSFFSARHATLLSKWEAEDRERRSSTGRPVVCRDCGARELEHFYSSKRDGRTLCAGYFQQRVERGLVREVVGEV